MDGNCDDGKGTQKFEDGSQYVGTFKDGQRDGFGKFIWSSDGVSRTGEKYPTSEYLGQFRNGLRHGPGVLRWVNGNVYMGDFMDGQVHGFGTKEYEDERTYIGNWRDGKREGFAKYTFADGSIYVGGYKDNKKHDETGLALYIKPVENGYWFVKYNNGKLTESSKISMGKWVPKLD